MSQKKRRVRPGTRPSGSVTEEGRKNQIASRLAYGVKANSPVLPGIEDDLEWERFRKGFWTLWQPVGIPEEECVDQIAGEYWIMRRIRRWETATTLTQLYELAGTEPEEVRREITRLLGEPVIRQNVFGCLENGDCDNAEAAANLAGNGNGNAAFTPSAAWWRKIVASPDKTPITHAEASWLMELVLEQVLPTESEDSENDDAAGLGTCDASEPAFMPPGKITVGELRKQLLQLGAASQQDDTPSVEQILFQGYQAAQEEAHSLELARIRARRFISERTLLPENRINTALVCKRQTMCLIRRHMAILERLQARRAGQFVPPPAIVDVNMTSVPREEAP
jgi:hypothetical protein